MKINDIIHGFKIERIRESGELKGTLYEMRHIKSGAELAFLDNKENNKLFSVAFKTLPWDDTGVFHILEHSVLAGSENYPVKEPFLDLLKSSMNTFLNAMTFPDKTVYPVSSRNEQDFINLTKVYLDAVFKPAIYKNESIFRQEGWHYELDEKGKPFYNGVVFNEMKGALSSVNGLMDRVGRKYLYPDSIYGFESGGDPKSIPDLTYEDFLRAHSEFYSPSNAKIYLDGDVPLERVLTLIDEEYLSGFDYVDKPHEIALQKPIESRDITSFYAIGKEDSDENKTYISYSKAFATWEERKRIMAYSLISSYLIDSNESPLKRAILENGLAQDISFYVEDGIAQPMYTVIFKNTDISKKARINAVYKAVLSSILEKGIDKDELLAHFNQLAFSLRELEEPAGLMRNIFALNSWLYGGDMLLYLENNKILKEVREAIDTDYFEGIIRELLESENVLTLNMLPSKTKNEEDKREEEARVNAEYSAFSEKEKAQTQRIYEKMREWQDTPDSPEATATLPVLSLSDVGREPLWTDTEELDKNGVKILYHKLSSNGIVNCNLFFDISDKTDDTLQALALLTELFSVLPTSKHSAAELQKEIKKYIGELDFAIDTLANSDKPSECKNYFTVKISALEESLDKALELVGEILSETDFRQPKLINENVLQVSETLYQQVVSAGNAFALKRVLSNASAASYVSELTGGYSILRYINSFKEAFNEKITPYISLIETEVKNIFVSSRLTLGVTADSLPDEAAEFLKTLPEGKAAGEVFTTELKPPVKEIILIPSGVSYAGYGTNIKPLGYEYSGKLTVLSTLLTFGYLWNEIRVHGGAYGCGFRAGINGVASFYSYRDPNPLNSVEVYKNTGEFIKAFVDSGEAVDRYIISSVAATEPLALPSKLGYIADVNFLMGYSYEDKYKTRQEMLTLKADGLLSLCPLFDKMREESSVCIVGNEELLSSAEGYTVYRL
ncbi:MAG: insulinase family protein [Eubacterium sp.]|nr:insulinase family protein [Eubacterium sp.]